MLDVTAELAGYIASAFVFGAFYMRTMVPLRIFAVASNVSFLAYAVPFRLWPIAVLHGLLLPLNLVRLFQIRRLIKLLRRSRSEPSEIGTLFSGTDLLHFAKGQTIFEKGEQADCAFYIRSGMVSFPEIGRTLGPGNMFGEMGLFSSEHVRTASAQCVESDVELYRLDEQTLVAALYQNSKLAVYLLRLIMSRMLQNLRQLEQGLERTTTHVDAVTT